MSYSNRFIVASRSNGEFKMKRCLFCSEDIEGFLDSEEGTPACSTCGGYFPELQAALTQAYRDAIIFVLVAIFLIVSGIVAIILIWNSYG